MKPLHTLFQCQQKLFSKELGQIHPFSASLQMQSDAAPPQFFKPCPVPVAIKDAISQELDSLEQQGIITPVTHSNWAAPIVPVPKKDGKFRICGDYNVTINQALAVEEYLPTPEEPFSTLSGGKVFSKLDLSQACLQLPVDEASKPYLTPTKASMSITDSHLGSSLPLHSEGVFRRDVNPLVLGDLV